ncbi:MAG TPA: RNA 2',3'-cyclic phosphodiesterase [Gaiellaceae bacterium]
MNPAASLAPGARLRLFCALRLPTGALETLVRWQRESLAAPEGVRLTRREQLHVTLAFLGSRPSEEVDPIFSELREAAAALPPPRLAVRRYRETRSVGMLVCDDEDRRAASLVADLHERLERLGVYVREQREWLPHITVIRFRQRPRLEPPLPALEGVVMSEAAVYMSVLRPSGAQYEVLQSVAVGGR